MANQPEISLQEVAQLVGGTLIGDANFMLSGAAPLSEVTDGQITLIDKAERLVGFNTKAALLVAQGIDCGEIPHIVVADFNEVHLAFAKIITHFRPRRKKSFCGISPSATVSPAARLAPNVEIYPGVIISEDVEIGTGTVIHSGVSIQPGCRIGENVTIFPNVTLYEDTVLGDRVILHAGVVLGAFGFGYRQVAGNHKMTSQLGFVQLEEDVEVGANSTIDRATYGITHIGQGTKIDNLVQIGHNCHLGKHNLICSQVGIAGSTTTGDYVVMGGQAGLRDHIHIGDRATLSAMSGVMSNVPDDAVMLGAPATPVHEQKLQFVAIAKLPSMRKEFRALTKTVAQITEQMKQKGSTSASDAA